MSFDSLNHEFFEEEKARSPLRPAKSENFFTRLLAVSLTVEKAEEIAKFAEKQACEAKTKATNATESAERALPHLLTVIGILIAAVIAIMSIYLTSIHGRIDRLERAVRGQAESYQMLFLGLLVLNTVWVFIYLCSKMIDRLRTSDKDNSFFSKPKHFFGFISVLNVAFIVLYIFVPRLVNLLR
ncbi:MAG: hypothetical protein FWC96_02755 [Oscillospiraceae bacterium]|nr:hypothetical protein [Oscillospiraceae bacterium]